MGKINILEYSISSKIAAGEVIERPVSVIKELVENSLDAGSKNITVEIEKGGKKTIKVIDDGEGIARNDLSAAFLRHATSKINELDDIFDIKTLGFRGEALASIAAVSKVKVISKTKNEEIGTSLIVNGGNFEEPLDASANNGFVIEIKDLFFNTPARLKFLSSDTQEASKITDLITRFAMGNINTSFRLINDGKEIFYTSGNGDYREAIAMVYGVDVAKNMVYIEKDFSQGKIWGYIALPEHSRGNRKGQTFFVNNRYIIDQGMTFALERAYKSLLPISRFPVTVIFVDIDNSSIDVNVHPAKTEIKFSKEKEVYKALYYAVYDALKKQVLIPEETLERPPIQKSIISEKQEQIRINEKPSSPKDEYLNTNLNTIYHKPKKEQATVISTVSNLKNLVASKEESHENQTITNVDKVSEQKQKYSMPIENVSTANTFTFSNILGQLFNTYIVAQGENEFYLIDQHAAHERILYDYYSDKFNDIATQDLVTPYVLHVSAQEMIAIGEYEEEIKKIGFDFSVFGNNSLLIRSVPYFFNKPVDPSVLQDAIDQLSSQDYVGFSPKDRFIISMSCHTAIRAGDTLSPAEIKELLTQLKNTENPYTCPHGRPTIISITLTELEKKFKRIQ